MANSFLTFGAAGTNLNVMSDAEFAASNVRAQGNGIGYADQRVANKAWLQSSVAAAVLMQFLSDYSGQNASDATPVATLENSLYLALVNALTAAEFAVASGTDTYAITLAPVPTAIPNGMTLRVLFNTSNTITTPSLNVNGLGAKTIISNTGGTLAAGDIQAGSLFVLNYDGSNWRLAAPGAKQVGLRRVDVRLNTGAGTFIAPSGVLNVLVEIWGGGGGGGGGNGTGQAGGGGAAGSYSAAFVAVIPGTTYNYTIGAGGPGSAVGAAAAGTSGGATSIVIGGRTLTAPGGGGGFGGASGALGGAPGVSSGGDENITGSQGGNYFSTTIAGMGGSAPRGGGGSGSGNAGNQPGGGAGGGSVSQAGALGANGAIRFTY